jgi:hypothetical protein
MALELENALEWSNGTGWRAGASTCDSSRQTAASSGSLRHFVELLRTGRHLPAIVRLKRMSHSSPLSPETAVPRETVVDEGSGSSQYVSFCRFTANVCRDAVSSTTSQVSSIVVSYDDEVQVEIKETIFLAAECGLFDAERHSAREASRSVKFI